MNSRHTGRVLAVLCYIPPLFIPLLFLLRRNSHGFFHAKQAIGTWAMCAVALGLALLPGRFFALVKWPLSLTAFALFCYLLICNLLDAGSGRANIRLPLGQYVDKLAAFGKLQGK